MTFLKRWGVGDLNSVKSWLSGSRRDRRLEWSMRVALGKTEFLLP